LQGGGGKVSSFPVQRKKEAPSKASGRKKVKQLTLDNDRRGKNGIYKERKGEKFKAWQ